MSQTLHNFTLTNSQTLNLDGGTTTLTGAATLGAGFVEGSGTLVLAAGATAVLDDTIFGGDAVFDIAGTATIDFLTSPEFGGGTQGNVGVTIELGGTFEFNPDGQGVYYPGSSMTNLGLLSSAPFYGTATNTLQLDLVSTGTILVANGTLALAGTGVSSLGGTITGPGALDLLNGRFLFDPAVLAIGTLIFGDGASGTLTGNQAFAGVVAETGYGTINLGGHTLALSGGGTLEGVVTGPGVLDVIGAGLVLSRGTVAGATLQGVIEATANAVLDNVVNDGTLVATGYGISLRDTITNTGGTIVANGAQVSLGTGVDIIGGRLAASGGGAFFNFYNFATLDGVTNTGYVTTTSGTIILRDSIINTGTINLATDEGDPDLVIATPVVALSGGGTIVLQAGSYGNIIAGAPGDTLDNIDNLIYGVGHFGNGGSLAVINAGTIESLGNSTYTTYGLTLDALAGVTNTGVIQATGTAPLLLYGAIANAGGTIAATGSAAGVTLEAGSDIIGGTLTTSAGGVVNVVNSTLDGVRNTGLVLVAAAYDVLQLRNSLINSGTVVIEGASHYASLQLATPAVTLSGGGTIVLSETDADARIKAGASAATLVNVDNLIAGAGVIGNGSPLNLALSNAGTIDADDATNALVIGASTFINTGLLEATGTAGLTLDTPIENAGGTIAATGHNVGVLLAAGSDVIGGTLATRTGGFINVFDGTLDGVQNTGLVLVTNAYTTLHLRDSVVNQGTIAVDGTAHYAQLKIDTTTVTLRGGGTIALSNQGTTAIIQAGAAAATLVNVDNFITGAGIIGYGSTLSVINAGTIDADDGVHALVVDPIGGVTNTGMIEATAAGGLSLSAVVTNTGGTIAAIGQTIGLTLAAGGDVIGGTLAAAAGGFINVFDGTLDGVRNTGSVLVTNAYTTLHLRDSLINQGTIAIVGTSHLAQLMVDTATVTLSGGGTIALSNQGANATIQTGSISTTLVNVDNLIIGAGLIGNGTSLALTNAATIDADTAANALVIDLATLTNTGLLEATGTGGLTLTTRIENAGGTIAASGRNVGVTLNGADVIGGTLATGAGGFIDVLDGTLDGVQNTGSVLVTSAYTTLYLRDSLINQGTIAIDGTSHFAQLTVDTATVTLSGGGTIALSENGASAYIQAVSVAATLVDVDNLIIGAGLIGNGTSLALTNAATIDADNATDALVIDLTTLTNTGLLEATGTGGLTLNSLVENAGGTIAAIGRNIGVTLTAGDVVGGTLTTGAGGFIDVFDGTLDGVANTGSVLVTNAYTTLHVRENLVNQGTIAVIGTSHFAELTVDTPTVTLSGGGTIALSNAGASAYIQAGPVAATLVNVDNLITGAGTIGNGIGLALANAGTIDADDATNALVLSLTTLTNTGLLEATGTAGLTLTGLVQNAGGTIAAIGPNIGVLLRGGDVIGGTLTTGAGGVISIFGATLDGVENTGSVLVTNAYATLHLRENLVNQGTIAIVGTSHFAELTVDTPTVTLSGGGTIALSNAGASATIEAGPVAATLVNVDNLITGAGTIGNGSDLALANAGTIDAGDATNALVLSLTTLTNTGLLEATGTAGLTLTGLVQNAGGTVAAIGPNIGVLLRAGGDVIGGALTTSAGGVISVSGGTLDGVQNTGTVLASSAYDVLHLRNSLINSGRLAIEGVSHYASLLIDTPSATLSGGGTVALSNEGASAYIGAGPAGATLVNVDNLIIGAGTIGTGTALALANAGTIDADDAALALAIGVTTLTNSGLLEATGSGGLSLSEDVLNTGGTIAALGAGVGVTLQNGADIAGGTLAASGGGTIAAGFATLDGVTNSGSLLIAAGDTVHLRDGLANAGRLADTGGGLAIDTPVVTLSGGGTITLAGTASIGTGLGAAMLDNVDNLILGTGTIAIGAGLTLVNAGIIDAGDTAAGLTLDAIGAFSNPGLLEATGAGGLFLSDSVLNAGGTIAATGAGVVSIPGGGDIIGGTVAASGGGTIVAGFATLDGVTNSGSLLLAAGQTLHLRDGFTNADRLADSGAVLAIDTPVVTLSGGGTIALSGSAVIDSGLAAATVDNVDNLITGTGTIAIAAGLTLLNAGIIDAGDTAALTIDAIGVFTNAGLLEATGAGGLQFTSGTTIGNAGGLVLAAGSQITLSDVTIAGGALATSGAGRFLAAGATLDGSADPLALGAGTTLAVAAAGSLTSRGSIFNAGTVLLGGSFGVLSVGGATTIGGGGLLSLGGGGGLIGGTAVLDDIDNTISGSGTIGGTLSFGAGAAVIGSAAGLLLDAATENAGLLESAGGTLAIGGVVRDAGGAITANGGLVSCSGADLVGGTLASVLSGTLLVAGSSTFDGSQAPVFASGSLLVDAGLDLLGTFANSGIATLAGTGAVLIGNAPATLAGGGTLVLGGAGALVTGSGGTLVDRDEHILGAGSLGGGGIGLVNLADGVIAATTGTLVIDAGAAGTIANAGAIEADGAALAVAGGFLSNTGTLAAFDARLTANGALQDQGGTLTGGTWLSSSVTAASTLAIGGAAVTEDNAEIILSGVSSTFLSGPSALALEQTLLTVDSTGTLALEGGRGFLSTTTLTNVGTLQLGQSSFGTTGAGTLVNAGVIEGTGTLSGRVVNLGTIAATADPLTIGAVSGTGTLLVDAGGGSMIVAGAVAGGTAQFGGAGATLTLQATAAFGDVIAGFGTGDVIDLADVGGVNALSYDAASHLLSLFMPQPVVTGAPPAVTPVATLRFSGSYTTADFGFQPDAAGHGTSIVVPCFLAGTRLLTTRGKIAVEDLAVGDIAVTVAGARPVVWIGQRTVACDRHPRPDLVWPVRIMADAFGPGLPERDLCLSPDHAVLWQGALIPVKHLLNGATIRQEHVAWADYYHVELDRHDAVLAEGLPAESYLDTGNRGQFAGGGTIFLHPDFAGCAPLCVAGETVAAARRHLLARVGALGFVRDVPRLWVLADGIQKTPVRVRGLLRRFLLPAGTGEVAIISSAGVPAADDVLAGDHRLLGACIGGIAVGGRAIALDDPALVAGFLAVETGGNRWTDGAARLALPAGCDPMVLDLLVHDVMPGWVGAGLRGALVAHEPAG